LPTWYDVRIVADGSTLKVYRDGEEILSATDSNITAGPVALTCDGNSDAYFDDVLVTSLADPVTTTHQYNSANELTTQTVGGGTATNFYYDAWGRMYSKAQGSYSATYAYKYGDKLVSITSTFPEENGIVYYKYGGDGKRRERSSTNPASYTWYNWSGWNVISEEDSGGDLQMVYVGRLAHIEEITPSGGTYRYYFQDNIGSTRRLRNADKTSYASYEFTPYGQVYDHSGSDVRHRFTGKEWDETAELYYFPYRYYSPSIARWMIRDPAGMVDGPNLYAYLNGNPCSRIDQFGLLSVKCDWEGLALCLLVDAVLIQTVIDIIKVSCKMCIAHLSPFNPACWSCGVTLAGVVGFTLYCLGSNCDIVKEPEECP